MNPQQIIAETLGAYLTSPQPAQYLRPLPPDLAAWYCHTIDGGHSILGLLAANVAPWPTDPTDYLVPIPVKSVLRGYRTERGYIVATSPDIRYDSTLGLIVPEEDNEY